MRRSILIAALLATTAMTPTGAAAGPVIGFIVGAIGVSATAAVSLGIGAGFAAGATFGATLLGGLIVQTVVAVGLSLLAAKLAPKPSITSPTARMVNFAQPISYAEWVFGRTRKGGALGFTGFMDLKRYYVPILAAHSISGIVEHWLDEVVVTLNTEADQNLSNIATGTNPAGYGRINAFLGQVGQVVDPGLDAAFTEITTAHDFKGLAGAVLWAKRPPQAKFSDIYPRGRQWAYAPVIDGNDQIYDPRDLSTGYSNNAALVLAYWLVNVLGRDVDWAAVAIEADVADEVVTNKEGGTQARWTVNGTISDDQEFEDQRAQIAAACDAFLFERPDGKAGFKVGRWEEPTVTLTADDFLSFEITEGNWGAAAPSEVSVTYTEPENAWRETPSGTWVVDAAARTVRDEPALYMITSHNQAARMSKRIAKTKLAQYKLRGTLGMIGYELFEQRFIRVVHEEMGIDEYFEVGELAREGVAGFTLSANSVDPTDFDFDAATEEPTRPALGSVGSNDDIAIVLGLTVTNPAAGTAHLQWDEQDESLSQQVRARPVGDTEWQVETVDEGESQYKFFGLIGGTSYDYQVRNRTASFRVGAWEPVPPLQEGIVDNPTPPIALVSFVVVANGLNADMAIDTPDDPNFAAAQIYQAVGSTDFNDAVQIAKLNGGPAQRLLHTTDTLSIGLHTFWGEPINGSGVAGPISAPQTISISAPGP